MTTDWHPADVDKVRLKLHGKMFLENMIARQ